MFGLMRLHRGPHSNEIERRWRMHYCGTCKTIGSRYGQRARLMLNHDAAFLGELLNSLARWDVEQWPDAYRSWNCMRLPSGQEMPEVLRYSAAANILLAEYKVRDHEMDSGRRRWVWVRRWLSPAFRKARSDLRDFAFPLEQTAAILRRQEALEATARVDPTRVDANQVAEPTAEVTALVFRHGAHLAGLDSHADALADIGYRFGRLIYLIDAWEDFDRDTRSGAFNPLRTRNQGRDWAAREIREGGSAIAAALESIGAPVEFRLRLAANIETTLGSPLRVLKSCTRNKHPTLGMRWREAIGRTRAWKAPLISFALVAAVAFLFPRHARLAKTSGECLSLSLNLMAVGGMLAMVAGPAGRPKGKIRSCCGGCDPGCDCCCEGCCDGICDACNCCESCGSCCECCSCDC